MTAGKARASFSDYAVDTASRLARSRDDECGIDAYPNPWKRYHDDKLLEGVNFLSNMYSIRNQLLKRQLEKKGNAENGAKDANAVPSPVQVDPSRQVQRTSTRDFATSPVKELIVSDRKELIAENEKRIEELWSELETYKQLSKKAPVPGIDLSKISSTSTSKEPSSILPSDVEAFRKLDDKQKIDEYSRLIQQLKRLTGDNSQEVYAQFQDAFFKFATYFSDIEKYRQTKIQDIQDKVLESIAYLSDEDFESVYNAMLAIQVGPEKKKAFEATLFGSNVVDESVFTYIKSGKFTQVANFQVVWEKVLASFTSQQSRQERVAKYNRDAKDLEETVQASARRNESDAKERQAMLEKQKADKLRNKQAYIEHKATWTQLNNVLQSIETISESTPQIVKDLAEGIDKLGESTKLIFKQLIQSMVDGTVTGEPLDEDKRQELNKKFTPVIQEAGKNLAGPWPKAFRSSEFLGVLHRLDNYSQPESTSAIPFKQMLEQKYNEKLDRERRNVLLRPPPTVNAPPPPPKGVPPPPPPPPQSSSNSLSQSLPLPSRPGTSAPGGGGMEALFAAIRNRKGSTTPRPSESDTPPSTPLEAPPLKTPPPPMVTPTKAPPPMVTTPSTAPSARTESGGGEAFLADLKSTLKLRNQKRAQEGGQPRGIEAYVSWLPGIWKMLGVKTPN